MNLKKLFEMQKVLRDRIDYNEPDRFNKLILALLVELGECANEWRGFKFWSKDQEPRTSVKCEVCGGLGWYQVKFHGVCIGEKSTCECIKNPVNPLLGEYVDGLHFVLEIGLEKEADITLKYAPFICDDVTRQFLHINKTAINLFGYSSVFHEYRNLLQLYLGLGEMLGFTWEEIEQAYITKNEINHQRQDNGY